MRLISFAGTLAWAILAGTSGASAEVLELSCTAPGSAQARHLTVDLGTKLVRNDMGGSGRPWAAKISDTDISWDEVFDSRIGHTANHYVLDRSAGTLHRTDMTRAQPISETLDVVCQKAP